MALPNQDSSVALGKFTSPRARTSDETFNALLEDDEEELFTRENTASLKEYKTTVDPIQEMLEKNFNALKKEFPNGGWGAYQLITTEVLLKAPKDWFDKYEKAVQEGAAFTKRELADRDRSGAIAESQADPTNEELQDKAFLAIFSILSEYLDKIGSRGIDRMITIAMVGAEIIGLSRIDPLWKDRRVDEIIINGPKDVQIEIRGMLYRVPACNFRDADQILAMLERIFSSINKSISKGNPVPKGRLHDQSRIQAVHPVVAPKGPNVAIRRHPDKFWTPEDLVKIGSIDEQVATFLGNAIFAGCSFMVMGGTSTGKTSFLNAMTGFYRDDVRIITLEDNLEMKPNPKKMLAAAMETVESNSDSLTGGVSMRKLVKTVTQMRPDAVVVGEVTDGAAYDLLQVLNTGHFGASTVHANSEFDGIYRIASLAQQGAELSQAQTLPLIAAAFDFIVQLEHFPEDGSRRVVSISEVNPYVTAETGKEPTLGVNQLFKFVNDGTRQEIDPESNLPKDVIVGHWEKTGEFSEIRRQRRHLDLIKEKDWEALKELSRIPEEFLEKDKKRQ